MKFRRNVILALVVLAAGMLLSSSSHAGGSRHGHRGHGGHGWHGGHGHRHHGGDSFHFGFAFAFPIISYGYYGYPHSYPYYGYDPVYRAPVRVTLPNQTAYNVERENPEYCREYTKKIDIDGKAETAYGTACLQEDGNWRIMN